jgi:hypothetical protein
LTEPIEVPARTIERERVVAYVCDNCGNREETEPDGFPESGMWFPVRVEAGDSGEEGHQIVERIFCDECFPIITGALVEMGFGTHYHGSTNFLEVEDCPGYKVSMNDCPTLQRSRYGDEEGEWGE